MFPPTEEHPLRVEFWGDDVEEIRYFRVADQRSLEVARHGLWAPPCRELLLTPDGARARGGAGRAAPRADRDVREARRGDRRRGHGGARAGPGRRHGDPGRRPGPRRLRRPARRWSCSATPSWSGTKAHDLVATSNEFLAASWHNAAVGNETPIDLGAATYRTIEEVREAADGLGVAWWTAGPFGLAAAGAGRRRRA